MDTDDFETIPSSGEESSNSSEDEADNKNVCELSFAYLSILYSGMKFKEL